MTTISKAKNLLIGSTLLAALSCPLTAKGVIAETGRSTSGSADVTAVVPEFIVLHYYSSIALNFITPDSETISEGENSLNVTWKGESSDGKALSGGSLMDAKLELDGTRTTVTLNDVWAVRGFSREGYANVAITLPIDKMTLGKSEIVMSNAQVSDGEQLGETIKTKLNGIARSSATHGGVQMDLDFTNTTLSGNHTGGKYMITATTI
ncbi:MAG: hypothetical protein HGA70_04305 [Chlorobiaceae bacterium]|nr:hypothetical protein [Chlorobiaceae bacterium]